MVEILGAASAIATAFVTARLGVVAGERWRRARDEVRFDRDDRIELDRAFARIVATGLAIED